MPAPKVAVIYTRISQDRTGAGLGVDRQRADCEALAKRLGMPVLDVYSDNDMSAYSGKPRPGYRKLLRAIENDAIGAVLCWHLDRLLRRPAELEEYIRICEPDNVTTHTVTAGLLDLSTPTGRMQARITAAVAVAETDRQRERQVRARQQKAELGAWAGNKRPFGFMPDGMGVIDTEADALRWACGQILSGMSLSATAKALNKREIFSSTGAPWDARTLRRVLLRPRNAGLSVHHGQVVGKAQWPNLVDELTWRGVVAVLENPTRRTAPGGPPRWLLTNLARCGVVIKGKVCSELVVSKSRVRPKMTVYTCSAGAHLSRNAAEV